MGFGDVGLCGITKYICERKQRYKIALKRMPSYQILLFGIAKDLLKSDKISYTGKILKSVKTTKEPSIKKIMFLGFTIIVCILFII